MEPGFRGTAVVYSVSVKPFASSINSLEASAKKTKYSRMADPPFDAPSLHEIFIFVSSEISLSNCRYMGSLGLFAKKTVIKSEKSLSPYSLRD